MKSSKLCRQFSRKILDWRFFCEATGASFRAQQVFGDALGTKINSARSTSLWFGEEVCTYEAPEESGDAYRMLNINERSFVQCIYMRPTQFWILFYATQMLGLRRIDPIFANETDFKAKHSTQARRILAIFTSYSGNALV